MWQEFFKFDLRFQLRQPLLWVSTLAMALLAFLTASNASFRIGGSIGNVLMNAPVVIANQLSVLSIVSMFLVTVFIAGAVLRDTEVGIADILFATPMRKADYLFGRFLAGFAACLAIFGVITLAMMIGSSMPFIDPERVGPFSFQPYLWSFLVFVLPNLLFISALLMLLAATTRSIILVYVGVLAFLVLWAMSGSLGMGGGNESLAVLLDPFGVRALAQTTRYFSSAESNTTLPALSGLLLVNRLVWTGIALALFATTVVLFKPQRLGTRRRLFGKAKPAAIAVAMPRVAAPRRIFPRFDASTSLAQWWAVLCFDTKGVIKSLPFLVMLLLAMANFIANVAIGGARFDSTPYPLTRLMLSELAGGINMVLVIILIFYSGELVFKDRQARIADVSDALPVPNWVPLFAKAGALVAVILVFLGVGALVSIGIQLVKGGAPIEGWLYVQGTLINAAYFVLMGLAILALQAITNNKYLGYLLALAWFAMDIALGGLNLNHRLYNFASLPALNYSDLNGYGHFLTGWSWFAVYWAAFAGVMLLVAQAVSARGVAQGWRARLTGGMRSFNKGTGTALALCTALFVGSGAWIYYNTNVRNHYEAVDTALDARADYEKLYRKYLDLPHPKMTRVRADVDIYPAERRVAIAGSYVLQNKTTAALDTLRIQFDLEATTTLLGLPPHTVTLDDKRLGFRIIKLAQPMAPGATMTLAFKVDVRKPGFTNSGAPDTINNNGTMFASENFFPKLGYVQAVEIEDRGERRQRGLGEPHGMPKLDDPAARSSNFWKLWGFDADLVDFETTVSTSADQVAIAPGRLTQRWQQGSRNYFHYKMDTPILPFFSYQSGKWDVKRADWRGLPVEVYFDKKHAYNIDSMILGTQKALDYFSDNFGPYQHKQVRITEFPLYQTFARSFPNTIPFSESLGFINDLRDPDSVDHVFYVTAHEVAHQWWGDQLIAANVQGNAMVTESLAEYSALMAVEKQFGAEKVRHILRFDLDQYLAGRSRELVAEQPLFKVENQVYIQYRKGSMIFYRLHEEIGEAAVNRALRKLLEAHRFQTSSYVTSRDVLNAIRDEAPADKQELITDMFERIVFYDNRMSEASAVQRADGQWDVTMKVRLAKSEADGKGKETVRAYDEPVEIAIFARAAGAKAKEERVLYRGKHTLPAGESTIRVTVAKQPFEAGVDPYNILIDRMASDNRKQVTISGKGHTP